MDADPAMNLAFTLGIPPDLTSKIVPIAENRQLIEERTGQNPAPDSESSSISHPP